MMGAASTSETSANFYQTTRRYSPEDNHLHSCRRENLKSNMRTGFNRLNFDPALLQPEKNKYINGVIL
jgi:hypothetical protein